MTVKLLTEQHLEFLSLKEGCTGFSVSTLVKIPHCWKSHVMTQLCYSFLYLCYPFNFACCIFRYRFRTYERVFCGTKLCDWLIKVGLCHDKAEAINYGRTLLIGQIICHVANEHHFHDMPYFYRFMEEEEQEQD